jgi:hypothetical protein
VTDGPDLSLITTEDMIEELKRRHPAFLMVTRQDHPHKSDGDVHIVHYHGGIVQCLGLAEYAKIDMTQKVLNSEDYEDPD